MGRRQQKPKPRVETHRVGRRIRVKEVRVIDANGEQLGIMLTQDAMARAEEANLQLVEVNPKASPPVCKIMDYGKFKYETAKRDREAKKNQKTTELKEVKFRPKTHDHDFDFKTRHIRRFLDEGDKVKLVVQFRGREITHPETGRAILEKVIRELVDVATVLQLAQMEGNRMNMVLAPKPQRPGVVKPKPPEGPIARPVAPPAPAPSTDGEDDDEGYDDDFDDDTTGLDDPDADAAN
ncbi:translation initiation factor IF-3 [Nannocystis sp. ILAH1]|uniref:translation initiation factor IF-3 n=1 Tax=unclassified Nannocystis TaxID=2627009 RepID=UPI0022709072|nr:translation initiation factor IF-3 [Nannocystis sp. ILAH1]MCY1068267.1 translation initiation factor IF-3 [Nannocystis sp. RBIL2]